MILPVILLALVLLQLALAIARGRMLGIRLRGGGGDRAARLRRWALGTVVTMGLPAVLALWLIDRADAIVTMPSAFSRVARAFGYAGTAMPIAVPLFVGLAGGTLLNICLVGWRLHRGRPMRPVKGSEGIAPLRRGDLFPAALLSIAAGVVEELHFRLLLPLLIAIVTGQAVLGFVVSALLFGLVHRYQGLRGVIVTTIVGGMLTGAYLASGALWLAMMFHAVIDLNALVVRPIGAGAWRRA